MKFIKQIWKTIVPLNIRKSRRIRMMIDKINAYEWWQYKKKHMQEYPIIKQPEDIFPVIYNIKKETYEKITLAATYLLAKESHLWGYTPRIDILKLSNAVVSEGSDIVICREGAIYDRMRSPLFSAQILCDIDLIACADDKLSVAEYDKAVDITGECVSLLGVHNAIWAHFLMQYFPKLGFLDRSGLLHQNVQVLIPKYADAQIKELLEAYQDTHPLKFIEVEEKTSYRCESLYYVSPVISMVNHGNYIMPWNIIFPELTKQVLKENLVRPWISKLSNDLPQYEKIYLVRRNTHRTMENWQEAEDYFQGEGFALIEPHKYSLLEKVSIFHHARVIVGSASSAFVNIQWCNADVKLLCFTNMARVMESTIVELALLADARVHMVTGQDSENNWIHTSYRIPLERIKMAYHAMLEESI